MKAIRTAKTFSIGAIVIVAIAWMVVVFAIGIWRRYYFAEDVIRPDGHTKLGVFIIVFLTLAFVHVVMSIRVFLKSERGAIHLIASALSLAVLVLAWGPWRSFIWPMKGLYDNSANVIGYYYPPWAFLMWLFVSFCCISPLLILLPKRLLYPSKSDQVNGSGAATLNDNDDYSYPALGRDR